MNNRHEKLRMMLITAIFAAFIGIFSQVIIPLPLVPITGQTLAVGLAATILGSRYGTVSVLLYLFIGAAGIPVFAGMTGGIGKIFGPTGGYLLSYIPTAFITGWILERTKFSLPFALLSNIIGMLITLFIGTVWFKYTASLTWEAAFIGGFIPFIAVGIIKAFLASWIGVSVRKRLSAANMLAKKETAA